MSPALAVAAAGLAATSAWPATRLLGRAAGWPLAALYLLSAFLLLPSAGAAVDGRDTLVRIPWVPARDWTLDLRPDPTGVLFAFLALVIGAVVLIYSTAYLDRTDVDGGRRSHYGFYQLMTLFTVSMLGLVLTDSLPVLFVCWELTSLASFALIANSGRAAYGSALRTLLVTVFGGLCLLAAVVAVVVHTGTTSVSGALESLAAEGSTPFVSAVAVLVGLAAMTKSAQWPFHFWLPDAMAAVTPVSAYLHAAAVVKAGIFLLLRFSPAFADVAVWNTLLVCAGMLTAVMAALFALQKTDLKQLMAYSTVSQLGWIVAAIGVGTPVALAAAALHTLAHALFKSGLFMLVGVVDHEAGSRDIRRLGPLWRRMPWTFGGTVLGAAAMAGIPPTLGFVSKESMLTAYGEVPGGPVAVVALLAAATCGAVLTVAYSARIVLGAFVDGPRDVTHVHEAPVRLWLPAVLPAAIGLPLAFVAYVVDSPLTAIASSLPGSAHGADHDGYHAHVTLWHGPTVELGLTVLILLVGGLMVWRRRQVSELLEDRRLLPFTGAEQLERLARSFGTAGRALVRPTASDSPSRHAGALVATVVAFGLGVGAWTVTGSTLPPRVPGLDRPIDVILLVVITVAVVGLCAAPSRIASVVLMSAAGIAVTIQMFALGAPDVGLTQLLVESLTIIMFMLVLRRLPGTFIKPSSRRRRWSIVLAVASGVAASSAAFVFTARRERSALGEYLLSNSYEITGGHNVVNVVLVEFRALDTLGEVSVLGMAGVAILAVLHSIRPSALDPDVSPAVALPLWIREPSPAAAAALADSDRNTAPLRRLSVVVTPVLLVVSAVLFLRGHNAPGGGFIAALVASCALALVYLSKAQDDPLSGAARPVHLVAAGLLLAGMTGMGGYALGEFLEPAHVDLAGNHLSSAMVFDLGVFCGVLGLVVTAFNTLGTGALHPFVDGAGASERPGPRFPLRRGARR